MFKTISHVLIMFVCSIVMSSCGGGGAAPSSTSTPTATGGGVAPSTSAPVAVSVSSSVAPGARALIAKISTASGSQSFNDAAISGEIFSPFPLVTATSIDNEIILASVEAGASVQLTATTTAAAIVRMLLDEPPVGVTEADWLKMIKSQPLFATLVASVDAALNASITPTSDARVLAQASALGESVASQTLYVARQTLASVEVDSELTTNKSPYKIELKSLKHGDLLVTGGLVNVYNSSPIIWAADSTTYEDKLLGQTIYLPAVSFYEWLAARTLQNWVTPTGTALMNDKARTFRLKIKQDDTSRKGNITAVMGNATKFVLGMKNQNDPGICAKELASALVRSELTSLALAPTMDTFLDYLKSAGTKAFTSSAATLLLAEAPTLCPGADWKSERDRLTLALVPLAARLNLLYKAYKVVDKIVDGYTIVRQLQAMSQNWRPDDYLVQVCVAGNKISNCAYSFKLDENLVLLEGGARFPLTVEAFDIYDKPTLVPTTLRFSVISGSSLAVDSVTGLVTSKALPDNTYGTTNVIKVQDQATGAFSSTRIGVETGKLSPDSVTLRVGGPSGSLTLKTANDVDLVTTGLDLVWGVDNASIVNLLAGTGRLALLNAVAAGATRASVYNPGTGKLVRASVTVQAMNTAQVSSTLSSVSLTVGGTQQLSAVAKDTSGNVISPQPAVTWSSANPSIATVSLGGLVTGVASGTTTVRITEPISSAYVDVPVTVGSAKPELSGSFTINPRGTYNPNNLARYDNSSQATFIRFTDFNNVGPGNRISLQISGNYSGYGVGLDAATAVFYGSQGYIAATGVTEFNTYCCGYANNSPNYQGGDTNYDFLIPRGQTLTVTIPLGADYIFFGTPSIFFSNNLQGTPPFSVTVQRLP